MVAASKLRRAQERVQHGAAVRDADAARAEQPGRRASIRRRTRCSTSARRRGPAAGRCSSSSPPTAACAAASTPTSSRRRRRSSPSTASARWRSAWSAGAAATSSRAAVRGPLRADQPVRGAEVRGRAGDRRRRRSRRSSTGEVDSVYLVYNEFKSVMSAAGRRRAAAADSAAGVRAPAPRSGRRAADRLSLRADAGGAVHARCCRRTSRSRCFARCSNRTPPSTPRG